MLNLDFLQMGLELASPPYFVYNFSRKVFCILYSINWPNFVVWLPLHFRYWGICVLQLFVSKVLTSKMLKFTWTFQSGRFSTWPKNQDKITYLENEKSFQGEIKIFFIIFQSFSVAKNYQRPESAPLIRDRSEALMLSAVKRFLPKSKLDCKGATTRVVLQGKVFWEISQNSQQNTCARISFSIKLQAPDSGTSVFQWILRNF